MSAAIEKAETDSVRSERKRAYVGLLKHIEVLQGR